MSELYKINPNKFAFIKPNSQHSLVNYLGDVEMTNKQQDNDSNKNMDGIFEFDAFF
jgi:hypothetical protein